MPRQAKVPYPSAMLAYPRLRQSLLSEFDACGLTSRFSMLYEQGFATYPQARGRTFHRFAAEALRTLAREGEKKLETDVAKSILHEVIRQKDADKQCPFCGSPRIRRGVDKLGRRSCLGCKQKFESDFVNLPMREVKDLAWIVIKFAFDNHFSIDRLVDVERRLESEVEYENPHGGVVRRPVTGQLDALFLHPDSDAHAIVLDWKDTWALPAPSEISEEGYFQQRLYAWLVMSTYRQIEAVTLREFYVRYSEPREATIVRDRMPDLADEFSALVERFDRSFEQKVWVPSPGKHCSFCVLPERCPIFPEARDEGRITTDAEARRVARQVNVAESALKRRKRQLEAWARTNGPVPMKDVKGAREFRFIRRVRVERPTKEQMQMALAQGGRVDLDRLYPEKVGTRFEQVAAQVAQAEDDREHSEFTAALQESLNEAKAARG